MALRHCISSYCIQFKATKVNPGIGIDSYGMDTYFNNSTENKLSVYGNSYIWLSNWPAAVTSSVESLCKSCSPTTAKAWASKNLVG